jgi:hypothetical protein
LVPEQAPLHARKSTVGVALRATGDPGGNDARQVPLKLEQLLIPAGALFTTPRPVTVTLSCGSGSKVAVTLRLPFIVTVHPPPPLQSPLQPVKAEEPLAVAVRSTFVPWG